jgi:hypothetical protein
VCLCVRARVRARACGMRTCTRALGRGPSAPPPAPNGAPLPNATRRARQDVSDREPFRSTADADARKALVAELHRLKTDLFMGLVEAGSMPLRPGVARLVREAIAAGAGDGGGEGGWEGRKRRARAPRGGRAAGAAARRGGAGRRARRAVAV